MLKKMLLLLVIIAGALSALIVMQSDEFLISRSSAIEASPAVVFAQVNDLHKMQGWSPWAKLDPNSKAIFSGPSSGVGASMSWAGNNKVGEGTMTITDSVPNKLVRMKLEFLKPFKATSTTEFTFQPEGPKTVLTWRMTGNNNFIGKAISLVMDCDKMVGGDFEKGLANLNAVVGKKPQTMTTAQVKK